MLSSFSGILSAHIGYRRIKNKAWTSPDQHNIQSGWATCSSICRSAGFEIIRFNFAATLGACEDLFGEWQIGAKRNGVGIGQPIRRVTK